MLLSTVFLSVTAGVAADRAVEIDRINKDASLPWTAGASQRFPATSSTEAALAAMRPLLGSAGNATERKARLRALAHAGNIGFKARNTHLTSTGPTPPVPDAFDSAVNWPKCAKVISDIRDQSNCGCCWAFSSAEAASDRLCIATNGSIQLPLSAQELCFCANNDGCGEGFPENAWAYIQETGLATGGQFNNTGPFGTGMCAQFTLPHCHHYGPQGADPYPAEGSAGCPDVKSSPACPKQCDSTATLPYANFEEYRYAFNGYVITYDDHADTIAQAIMEGGPVTASYDVYSDFVNYVGGVYVQSSQKQEGGHAVKIVGWGVDNGVKYECGIDDPPTSFCKLEGTDGVLRRTPPVSTGYWKVANSWNKWWGEQGYFRIRRGTDECGIESSALSNAHGGSIWTGPHLLPPNPSPPPPPSGACSGHSNAKSCAAQTSEGKPCKFCALNANFGTCQPWTQGCLDEV